MPTNDTSERSTMIVLRSSAGCVALLLVLGCAKDATFEEPLPAYAAVHWVNAVPDTGQQDMRVVDVPSNAGLYDANFRGSTQYYQAIQSGARTIRIFNSSENPAIAQQILQEATIPFTEDSGYTLIHAGFARTGGVPARRLMVVTDNPAAPAAGQVGLRFIHAGAGIGAVDFNVTRHATDTLPDVPLGGNLAFGSAGIYNGLKADSMRVFHPRTGVDSIVFYDTLRVVVTAAGTKTPVLLTSVIPRGQPNTINQVVQPIAGPNIPGTVQTVLLVPPSVAGSAAPQGGAFTSPATVIFVDRRPPPMSPAP